MVPHTLKKKSVYACVIILTVSCDGSTIFSPIIPILEYHTTYTLLMWNWFPKIAN